MLPSDIYKVAIGTWFPSRTYDAMSADSGNSSPSSTNHGDRQLPSGVDDDGMLASLNQSFEPSQSWYERTNQIASSTSLKTRSLRARSPPNLDVYAGNKRSRKKEEQLEVEELTCSQPKTTSLEVIGKGKDNASGEKNQREQIDSKGVLQLNVIKERQRSRKVKPQRLKNHLNKPHDRLDWCCLSLE